jgi:hypothetical protein
MLVRAAVVWVLGLVTAVPYATYYLLFYAQREQYAMLATFVLFWIFGYWSLAGPLIATVKVRQVVRAIERAQSKDDLKEALLSDEARDVAIDMIASDNHIPRFLAAQVYRRVMRRLSGEAAM